MTAMTMMMMARVAKVADAMAQSGHPVRTEAVAGHEQAQAVRLVFEGPEPTSAQQPWHLLRAIAQDCRLQPLKDGPQGWFVLATAENV